MTILSWKELKKAFNGKPVIENLSGEINQGDIVVITGPSGSGKSTLLNILGLLEPFDGGEILWWDASNVKPFSRKAEGILRDKMGYLFQNFALIDHETVRYNLSIAMDQVKMGKPQKETLMKEALEKVGLPGFIDRHIYECSGGEQQRIAIARLLLKPCEVVMADEPTGSLDDMNKKIVIDLLLDLNRQGKTLIIATHDAEVRKIATKQYDIPDLKKQLGQANRKLDPPDSKVI